jgi:hypothetical protein
VGRGVLNHLQSRKTNRMHKPLNQWFRNEVFKLTKPSDSMIVPVSKDYLANSHCLFMLDF